MDDALPPGPVLSGRRGWTTVTVLGLALLVLVGGQVAATEAQAGAPASATAEPARLPADAGSPAAAPAELPEPAAAELPEPAPAAGPEPAAAAEPPPAPAEDRCSGEGWQQRRGAAALASLRAGAERTGFTVAFAPARPGYLGLTHLQERRIEVFVRACDAQSDELLRHVMAHELGHAYDTTQMNAATRAAWQLARGIPASTSWYGCSGCTDFATPAGDFAEVYAQWVRGAADNRSELSGAPAPAELQALAQQFFGA